MTAAAATAAAAAFGAASSRRAAAAAGTAFAVDGAADDHIDRAQDLLESLISGQENSDVFVFAHLSF